MLDTHCWHPLQKIASGQASVHFAVRPALCRGGHYIAGMDKLYILEVLDVKALLHERRNLGMF